MATPDFTGFVSNNDPRVQPGYVQPSPQGPSSLSGTMGSGGTPPTGTTPQTGSDTALANALTAMQSKFSYNNKLMENRNLLLKALYNTPLTDQEKSKLDPSMLDALNSGDRNRIDLNLRLISDEVAGRNNTLDKSFQFLVDSYEKEQEKIENQKQDAISNVLSFAQVYGSNAKSALTSLYGPEYVEKLKGMGIDLDKFSSMKTLAQIKSEGDGSGGSVSSMTQAVIDNPSLFDDLTPTNRGKVIAELQSNGYDTANLGTKGLSDTAIKEISQTQKALDDLDELRGLISSSDYVGPVKGFARVNPYSKARQIQADVDRVRQTVGRALEGGVLRKEDEEKYKKILATLNDTPETALYKIDALVTSINRDLSTYQSLQQSSGRSLDVGASLKKKGSKSTTPSAEELRRKYNY